MSDEDQDARFQAHRAGAGLFLRTLEGYADETSQLAKSTAASEELLDNYIRNMHEAMRKYEHFRSEWETSERPVITLAGIRQLITEGTGCTVPDTKAHVLLHGLACAFVRALCSTVRFVVYSVPGYVADEHRVHDVVQESCEHILQMTVTEDHTGTVYNTDMMRLHYQYYLHQRLLRISKTNANYFPLALDVRLAVCMANHPRLGADSPLSTLHADLLKSIFKHV